MKIVLGVDQMGYSDTAIELLQRLNFPGAQVDAVHVVEVLRWAQRERTAQTSDPLTEYTRQRENEAQETAERAAQLLSEAGIENSHHVRHGYTTNQLVEHAEDLEADLIAVGNSKKDALQAFFTGSTGRGLVISAHQSVLVAKQQEEEEINGEETAAQSTPAPGGVGLTAIVATDHSDYVNRCLDRLLKMSPQGIERLVVLSSATPSMTDEDTSIAQLREANLTVCERLAPLSAQCSTREADEHPISAINTAMREENADLLILGAQGHGFLDRLKLGSVSFHHVVAEPHPVLVLRV